MIAGGMLPSPTACLAAWEHLAGHCAIWNAGLDGPSLV